MVRMLQKKMKEEVDESHVDALVKRLGKCTDQGKIILPYDSVCHARKRKTDPCHQQFTGQQEIWDHCRTLLIDQKYRCEVSGILMSDTCHSTPGSRLFAPSLDAIDPTKGHVPGNVRWICSFLNNGNCDKQKNETFEDDDPTAWDRALWREYVYGSVALL